MVDLMNAAAFKCMFAYSVQIVKTQEKLGEKRSGANGYRVPDLLRHAIAYTALNIYLNCDMKCNSSLNYCLNCFKTTRNNKLIYP